MRALRLDRGSSVTFLGAFVVVALQAQASLGATPRLFTDAEVSPVRIAETVNRYVEMGEEKAVAELLRVASASQRERDSWWEPLDTRMIWVCRLLYEPKPGDQVPDPALGEPPPPFQKLSKGHWPLQPIALSGTSYFVLCGHTLDGVPERLPEHLAECRKHGTFRKTKVPVPTREQAIDDAAALRRTQAWTSMNWGVNQFGLPDDEWTWRRIDEQARNVD